MKLVKLFGFFAVTAFVAGFAGNVVAFNKESVDERIKPVFSVYIEGDQVPQVANEMPKGAEPSGPRTSEDIYNTYCGACHNTGVAGAPKKGDAAAWAPRVDAGMDTVYANAINGLNAMPAKGTCADCTDDEIKATIDYILENSQ